MWKIDPDLRMSLLKAAERDEDRDAALAIRFLFESGLTFSEAMSARVSDLDRASGHLFFTNPSSGAVTHADLSPALMRDLVSTFQDDAALIVPLISRDPYGKRLQEVFARIGPPLGMYSIPKHQRSATEPGSVPVGMTRDCLDPWINLEVTVEGVTRPCCMVSRDEEMQLGAGPLEGLMLTSMRKRFQEGLLSGDLEGFCQTCNIRRQVPIPVLRERVEGLLPETLSFPTQMRVELTTNCNLRCTYCMVTAPDYVATDMRGASIDAVLEVARRMPREAQIFVNGHGETTFHPDWKRLCRPLVEMGFRPVITTNMARTYDDEEIALLARFGTVQLSIDSSDAEMMRRIRKAVSPKRVVATLERIRAAAEAETMPMFTISAGLYDPSIWVMPEFGHWIVENRFDQVTFWSLIDYAHATRVRALNKLSGPETARARQIIRTTVADLAAAGVRSDFAGDFLGGDGMTLIA